MKILTFKQIQKMRGPMRYGVARVPGSRLVMIIEVYPGHGMVAVSKEMRVVDLKRILKECA